MLYTRHSVLKRGCSLWDKEVMPETEFEARVQKTRHEMTQVGLNAVVIYGDNWSYADLCYLTNYFPKVRGAIGVIPTSGPVSLLVNIGSRDIRFAKTLTWVEDVRASNSLGRDAAELLKERNLADAKIGLIDTGRGLPLPQLEALRSLLPRVHWQSCDRMLQQMRLKKSGRELAVLRKGARVLQRIFQEAEAIIQTGRKECEMVAELDRLARHKGVEDVRLLVGKERLQPPGSGPDTLQGHWAVYLSIQYGRYWVEAGRSFNLDSDPGFEQAYGKARDSLEAMSANIRPGQSLKTVDDGVRRCLGDLHATAAAYGLGNGIGLSPWEAPFLDQEEGPNTISSNAQTLECDMTLTLRVGIAPERNLALFGDSYHVTARGLIPLSESTS